MAEPGAAGGDELKTRLEAVNAELRRIQSEVKRDADSLERFRQRLDTSYLDSLMALIDGLEARVNEATSAARAAEDRSAADRRRLQDEEERLVKLWDIYKTQEKDVRSLQEKTARLEDELKAKDTNLYEIEGVINQKDAKVRSLEEESNGLRRQLAEFEGLRSEISELEHYKADNKDLNSKIETERERLAKLYTVYEETEAEKEKMSAELAELKKWFEENRPAIEALSRGLSRRPAH
jgi:chromosome segregation ATPase